MKWKILIAASLLIIAGCKNKSSEDYDSSEGERMFNNQKTFDNYSVLFKSILLSGEDVVRNVQFGMTMPEIRYVEKEEHIEEGDDYITYGEDFSLSENFDVTYKFDKKEKLNEIEITSYHGYKDKRDELLEEFKDYISSKFGDYNKVSETEFRWEGIYAVSLQITGNEKNPNLQLNFFENSPW